jgi:uncharacterized integral membrane protein
MRWTWLFTLPLTVLLVIFAVMNRESVHVELWPWPWDAELPLFLLVGASALAGFLIGAAAMWFSGSNRRRKLRELSRESAGNAKELKELRQASGKSAGQPGDAPRLPGPA